MALGLLLGDKSSATAAEAYLLGSQDRIRIKVLEWLPGKGAYEAWDALDGEYVVSTDGHVSIPLIGPVEVGGEDAVSVASRIGEALQVKTGLRVAPTVSVELVQFRPVYVVGAVRTPGEYAWRPELDVIKAIGLAGGRYRPYEGSPRLERDVITTTGVLHSIELEITRTLAKRARLAAEIAGSPEIDFPDDVTGDPMGAQIMEEERAILASQRESLERRLAAIDELKSFLDIEIDTLKAKVAVLERQLASAREELSNVADLASRGLSPANRQLAMDRVLGDLQSGQLDLSTAIIRVRQSLATAERDRISLIEERRLQRVKERQEAQALLDQLYSRRHTTQRLIYEASVIAPQMTADQISRQEVDVAMQITREVEGRAVIVKATRTTPVLPGDVVEVIEVAATRLEPEVSSPGRGTANESLTIGGTPTLNERAGAAAVGRPLVRVPAPRASAFEFPGAG